MAATRERAIRDELDRVLASAAFARADRLRRFLRFVVEETLAGRQDDIKESVIALHVCGRDGSFDAKTDPIVRVDATRLRARLGEYYDTQGHDASLRIDLPKGSYVPRFVAGPAAAGLRGSARPLAIAVLPFVNIGAGADDGFSDGLTEELIHQLSRIPALRVIARTSAFQYRARSVDVRKIAADLNVSHVVEGSVRAAGEQIRVTAQLTAVDDRTIRWSAKYERQLTDVLKVQDDICANVTRALQLELLDGAVPARASSASARAHVAYLKGRHFWNRRTAASLMQSLEQYAAAVALDEHYARAYCGMADTLFVQALNDQLSAADAMPRAIEHAIRALDVDPDLPEALVSLASIASIYEWDWLKGDALFRHATSLNPRAPLAPYLHAVLNLAPRARWEEALVAMDAAMELDPVSPVLHRDLGMIHYLRGDYREAEAVLRSVHALDPSFHGVYFWLARTLIEAGRLDDARGALQSRLAAPAPNARVVATMIEVLIKTGRATEAEDHWDALQRRAGEQTVPPLSVALAYLARGDRPAALAWLEQAARDRAPALYQLAVDPVFRPLRDEPAFAAILRTMGLGRVR